MAALTALSLATAAQANGDASTAPTTSTPGTTPTKTQTVTKTETVTTPPKTTTVTAPTQTNTVVKTETVTTPTPTTPATTNHPGAAAAAGAAAARDQQPESEEGLPGWAWGLIGLAVGGAAIGAIWAYRGRRHQQPGPPGQNPTPGDPPPGV